MTDLRPTIEDGAIMRGLSIKWATMHHDHFQEDVVTETAFIEGAMQDSSIARSVRTNINVLVFMGYDTQATAIY